MSATLFDAAREARDAALAAVDEHARPDWKDIAYRSLDIYLRTHETMFVDDFWTDANLPAPRESRALGPVFLRAVREGLMVKDGTFRPSVRSHLQAKPVWRSRVYEQPHT